MLKKVFIAPIKAYRKFISPLKKPCCRFYPSCSQYAIEAIDKHGVIKGGGLALYRILRCNPFSAGGVDPVPGTYAEENTEVLTEEQAAVRTV